MNFQVAELVVILFGSNFLAPSNEIMAEIGVVLTQIVLETSMIFLIVREVLTNKWNWNNENSNPFCSYTVRPELFASKRQIVSTREL